MTNKQQQSERTSKPKVEIKFAQSSNKADGNCDTSARLLGAKIPPRDAQRTPGNENRLNLSWNMLNVFSQSFICPETTSRGSEDVSLLTSTPSVSLKKVLLIPVSKLVVAN